jgi:hypothetical protein
MAKSQIDSQWTGGIFGDILSNTVRFERIKPNLIRMLHMGIKETEIIKELHITQDDLFDYKKKLRHERSKVNVPEPKQSETNFNQELLLEVFMENVRDDVDVVCWSSYNGLLKFSRDKLAETKHTRDRTGLILERTALKKLIRISFCKLYPKQIIDYIREQKICVVAIRVQHEDSKSLAHLGFKLRNVSLEIQHNAFRSILQIHREVSNYYSPEEYRYDF